MMSQAILINQSGMNTPMAHAFMKIIRWETNQFDHLKKQANVIYSGKQKKSTSMHN